MNGLTQPQITITEQPARLIRFRYEREGRTGGLVLGVSTTPTTKTYPTLKIENCSGSVLIIASCVTKEPPYRPHPHKLVGNENCRKGVCTVTVPDCTRPVEFSGLGIHCTKKRDIAESLRLRQEIKVDPYRTGFHHANETVDLTALRLCFQVFLNQQGRYVPLSSVVSEAIYDKRIYSDLNIVKLSKCTCPADGGMEDIILVCEKVAKDDVEIRFFEEKDGKVLWEGFGQFNPTDVHKHVVIWFKPPPYKNLTILEPVQVFVELRRKSDKECSRPVPFQFTPLQNQLKKLNRMQYHRTTSDPLYNSFNIPSSLSQQRRVSSNNVPNIPPSFTYQPETERQMLNMAIPSTSRDYPITNLGPTNDDEDSLPVTLDMYNNEMDMAASVHQEPETSELTYLEIGHMATYQEVPTASHLMPGMVATNTLPIQNIPGWTPGTSTSEMELEVPSGVSDLISDGDNFHEIKLISGELDHMSS